MMAKVVMPLMSGQASGQFAQTMVFQKNGVVREYKVPANPNTVAQQGYRNRLGDIQRELKTLGVVLRTSLPADLGSHWNSLIIKEICENEAAYWIAKKAVYDAFQAGEKTNWGTADTALGLVNEDGACLFIVSLALYDVTQRITGTASIPLPEHDSAAAVGAAWVADA
jgi:hypothetical protein